MATVCVFLSDSQKTVEIEVTEYELPPRHLAAARRSLGPVPLRPKIHIPGYVITQLEIFSEDYAYVAHRI